MNEFQAVFFPMLALGCVVGSFFAWLAAGRRGLPAQVLLLLVGIAAVWFALVVGVQWGFDAWQSIDNPPEEAYADGAQLTGSVMFGWMPSGMLCFAVFFVARGWRQRATKAR